MAKAVPEARELDEKFAISDLMDQSSRAAGDAAKRGAQSIKSGAEKLRGEAERFAEQGDVGDTARRAAGEAVRGAGEAGRIIRDAAGDVGKQAGEVLRGSLKVTTIAPRSFMTRQQVNASVNPPRLQAFSKQKIGSRKPRKAALVSFSW